MAKYKRVLAIVLDSVGIGEQHDSEAYGDKGAHTLKHALEGSGMELSVHWVYTISKALVWVQESMRLKDAMGA